MQGLDTKCEYYLMFLKIILESSYWTSSSRFLNNFQAEGPIVILRTTEMSRGGEFDLVDVVLAFFLHSYILELFLAYYFKLSL